MTGTALWLAVIGMGVATYALRISFIALLARMELPRVFQEALGLVPAAVLAALVFPAFFRAGGGGAINVSLANEHLLAGALAVVVAWRTRNVLLTIGVGMVALVALRAMGQAF